MSISICIYVSDEKGVTLLPDKKSTGNIVQLAEKDWLTFHLQAAQTKEK